MFSPVNDPDFISGEHQALKFWDDQKIFEKLQAKNKGKKRWSFLDGPITANNPMGVHHAWGRTYKDTYQRFYAMTGHDLRYQNGFDCQGLWVEVEVEKQLGLGTKNAIKDYGVDKFVNECKKRVLKFAARQTEQSIRLGYWTQWDNPTQLRLLSENVGTDNEVTITTPNGQTVTDKAHKIVEKLGNPEWGGSYFTFSTENNETIWTFLKKCFTRGKVYKGHDVMPWSGRGGSAYSQMEVADGRKLTTHRSVFVRFPLIDKDNEYLLVWTTTPWTLTSNVAAAINPDLEYVKLQSKKDGAVYYFAKDNLNYKRLDKEFKEGFGRPEWSWPESVGKLKTVGQLFKEQGGFDELGSVKGAEMVGWKYKGPFDELAAQKMSGGFPNDALESRNKSFSETIFLEEKIEKAREEYVNARVDTKKKLSKLLHDLTFQALYRGMVAGFYFRKIDGHYLGDEKESFEPLLYELKQLGLDHLAFWKIYSSLLSQTGDLNEQEWLVFINDYYQQLLKEVEGIPARTAVQCHRVIDGGKDSKGAAIVVQGEGTGIVHIAPGCGDVDYHLGEQNAVQSVAPLKEDGRFDEGFGEFTGREAIDPTTIDLVLEKLKASGFLVYVEQYPHIYPHCWRTGDELVFRMVDEWFINMDWRDEIKDVTRCIEWLPESIDGQNREVEWLTNMRDWMISKKRFWGLALPIWVDDETGDFEVIGSLAELKERAVEGWEQVEANTPHKPWIDAVKIKNPNNGNLMRRVEDVGNPWLDAGIVPFSTMGYNHDRAEWAKWFPADLVTECFPGQFRNWFYSMLSMATMMRYEEENAEDKKPFKTLLGHRLVMNEEGKPMHKSDGTAIWFEEAAEQLGVDTLRWMYLAQNPAADLRFGTRHKDVHVTLQTLEGPLSQTREGVPCCKVTSKPADDIRRAFLIPLWNSYSFFVNYARLDEFDVTKPQVPYADRPEIDRWVLSRLQSLIATGHKEMGAYNAPAFMQAAGDFIDDLSNWYIRRNRRRFWRAKDAGDTDKLAAYQTLHEVLVTLTKLLAPVTPFLAERMYQNLVRDVPFGERGVSTPCDFDRAESVHLCDYPTVNETLLDDVLNTRTATAQKVVQLGHKMRESQTLRVRQPLSEIRVVCTTSTDRDAVNAMNDVIRDELNVKAVNLVDNLDGIVKYSYKPNLKTLGKKLGKLLNAVKGKLETIDAATMAPLRDGQAITLEVEGQSVSLEPDDVLIATEQSSEWLSTSDFGIQVALSAVLTEDLIAEGYARDFVRLLNERRKIMDLSLDDRIEVKYAFPEKIATAIEAHKPYIMGEILAKTLVADTTLTAEKEVAELEIGDNNGLVAVTVSK
ncbi:isoleucine--tRNA ligase [Lacunimicrobium album]